MCVVFGNVERTATSSDVKNRYRAMTRTNLRLVSSASQSIVQTDRDDFRVLLGVLLNGDSEKNIFEILSRTIEARNGILCHFFTLFPQPNFKKFS